MRAPHLESQAHLQAETVAVNTDALADYYLDPLNQIVHVCLSIEAYCRDSQALARDLQQPPHRIAGALAALERMRLIERVGTQFRMLKSSLHLRQGSQVYRPWRNQLKILSMAQLDRVRDADAYSFANVFSADRATAAALRIKFLKFLKEADADIKAAPEHNVFQLSFDLFAWTERAEPAPQVL